ncbi:MAG: hypothetical protein HUJ25_16980 [Crocinitomicaceae bacterium]|nr:hypothetical protein [Crocinitomicaceae bacterium]
MLKKLIPICLLVMLMVACSKEIIESKQESVVEETANNDGAPNNQDLLFEELDRELKSTMENVHDSRGVFDVGFPLNQWDFVGSTYTLCLDAANRLSLNKEGEVNIESVKEYFNTVNQHWLTIIPGQDQFKTENNINQFELDILEKYNDIIEEVNNSTAHILISKVFERFVIRNVSDEQRQQRLLVYMSLYRHTISFFHTNGVIVNGNQIFNDVDGVGTISPQLKAVHECMHGYAVDHNWGNLEWYGWSLAPTVCMSIVAAECIAEVYNL